MKCADHWEKAGTGSLWEMSSEIELKARVGRANFSNRRVISGAAVAITNHTAYRSWES